MVVMGYDVLMIFAYRFFFFSQAMRYPLNAHRKELAAAEGAREREKELAKEIQEGELEDDDDMFE